MTELLTGAGIVLIAFGAGSIIGALSIYLIARPQLNLLHSMIVDRHAVEVRRTGVKSSVPEIKPPESAEKAVFEQKPPFLVDRIQAAEKVEIAKQKQNERMMEKLREDGLNV